MGSSSSSQSPLKCSICLDVFTEPVSTPCGHNFCRCCLSTFWDSSVTFRCPLCQQLFKHRPELKTNVLLRDLLGPTQSGPQAQPAPTRDVPCGPCGDRRARAVSSCLNCEESFCSEHLKPHRSDPELSAHELLAPVRRLKARVCKEHSCPLELVCHEDLICVCVMCISSKHQQHQCVPLRRRLRHKKLQVEQELSEVQQKIQERRELVQRFSESERISERNTAADVAQIMKLFLMLQRLLKLNEAALVTALMLLQKKNTVRCESTKKKLQTEVVLLEKRQKELEELRQAVDGLHLLQSWNSVGARPETEDWAHVSPFSDAAVGTARSAVSKLLIAVISLIKDGAEALEKTELRRVQQYAVEVTLDPDTANRVLLVSKEGTEVSNGGVPQTLPDNPERFDTLPGVLGKQGFSSGAFYFQVQVEEKASWEIGVAVETVNRKGPTTVSLSHGFAVLTMKGDTVRACDRPAVELELPRRPQTVGVFVDVEQGEVGFYDVDHRTHIYSFTSCRFPRVQLHPYFCLHPSAHTARMVLTPVSSESRSDPDPDSDSDLDSE